MHEDEAESRPILDELFANSHRCDKLAAQNEINRPRGSASDFCEVSSVLNWDILQF
jgi:hypothetical protein